MAHYVRRCPFCNTPARSGTVADVCQYSDHSPAQGTERLNPANTTDTSAYLAARAREVFGNYATLHVRSIGYVEVFVERYAIGERGELIVIFRHPVTNAPQVDGL